MIHHHHGVPKGLRMIPKKDPKLDTLSKKYLVDPLHVSADNLQRTAHYIFTDTQSISDLYSKGAYGTHSVASSFEHSILNKQICKPGDVITTLSPYELLYLTEKKKLDFGFHMATLISVLVPKSVSYNHNHYELYKYLRFRNYIIKTGHNYGGVFAVYLGHPDFYHSSAIIFEYGDIHEITAHVRVAQAVNKQCWLYKVNAHLPEHADHKVMLYQFDLNLQPNYISPLTALAVGEVFQEA
uniref:tRNA-intron lyase n=1 Tax=Panagrellus redivivus TaxID=6233 RepID=A0A7E4W2H6_PANRE